MSSKELDLGAAELEVLKALWECEPAPVRTVMNRLHQQGRRQAYTTVQTMLTRLEQKGFVQSDKSGLAFVYRACTSREQITQSRLRSLLDQLFDGAAGSLVLQLVKDEALTRDEIRELHQLVDRLDSRER